MSDYGGSPLWGFASALPEEFFPSPIDRRLFPTTSDRDGRDSKALIHVLPFIPMGALRGRRQTVYEEVLADPLKSELIIKGFLQTERVLQSGPGRKVGCRDIHTARGRALRHFMMWASATWSIEKLEELRETRAATISVPQLVTR